MKLVRTWLQTYQKNMIQKLMNCKKHWSEGPGSSLEFLTETSAIRFFLQEKD